MSKMKTVAEIIMNEDLKRIKRTLPFVAKSAWPYIDFDEIPDDQKAFYLECADKILAELEID